MSILVQLSSTVNAQRKILLTDGERNDVRIVDFG